MTIGAEDAQVQIRHALHQCLQRLPDSEQRSDVLGTADPTENGLRGIAADVRPLTIELIELGRVRNDVDVRVVTPRIAGDMPVLANHAVGRREDRVEILPSRSLERRQPQPVVEVGNDDAACSRPAAADTAAGAPP